MLSKRNTKVVEILTDLNQLKSVTTDAKKLYAINQNIIFFESVKNFFSFIYWLVRIAPKIEKGGLLEINDILPKYDEIMHVKLIEMERKPKPGLIKPVFDRIVSYIEKSNKDLMLASFGSGGMELERQIIEYLIKNKFSRKIIFIAIDQSDSAHKVSKNNHAELNSYEEIYDIDNITNEDIEIVRKNQQKQFAFIHCKNDIFTMGQTFSSKVFDLSYHTHFKHHLTDYQKGQLDEVMDKLSKKVIEYDGFINWVGMIPQTIIGWNNPVFLNAEILSNLRYFKKDDIVEIVKCKHPESYLSFSKLGFYVLEYNT